MELNFKSLPALLDHFRDEQTCIDFLAEQRWGKKPCCTRCGVVGAYKIEGGKRFKCKDCGLKFSVKVGTVFENSNIELRYWFAAVFLATANKKGISSTHLARQLDITQKTAWFILHRVREMLREKAPHLLEGEVQADETFVGGKNKNRHAKKKIKDSQGRSLKDKTPVFGLVNKGRVKTQVVPDTKATTLKPIIEGMVKSGSIVITDEWHGYTGLAPIYQHEVVSHHSGEYARNGFHNNSIEGFWSLFKRGIFGIYHYASPKHLSRYTDEFSYRYNTREMNDKDRFVASLTNVEGRLTYKQLIQK